MAARRFAAPGFRAASLGLLGAVIGVGGTVLGVSYVQANDRLDMYETIRQDRARPGRSRSTPRSCSLSM